MQWLIIMSILLGALEAAYATDSVHPFYSNHGDWEKNDKKKDGINLSSFVYRDFNRNGTYDVGDRPMVGVVTELSFNGVPVAEASSNVNGYGNFSASKHDGNAPIHKPGRYSFNIIPPKDWRVTSGNAVQESELVEVFGSIGGVGFEEMPKPVGLASTLAIEGTVVSGQQVTLVRSGGEKLAQVTPQDGIFSFPVDPGSYRLVAGGIARAVSVTHYPVHMGRLRDAGIVDPAGDTITFDKVSESTLRKVPSGYHGLEWFNLNAMHNKFTKNSIGYVNGTVSEPFIAYTSSGHPATISSQEPFDLIHMHLSSAWLAAEGETAIIELWRGEEKVQTDEVMLSIYQPVMYAPHIQDITKIRLASKHYWQIIVDDIMIRR